MKEREIESKCVLRIRDLKKSFGKNEVHKGVSFDLYRNEFIALMGTSGGGKSLILRSIVGLERADSGQIWFEGRDLMSLSERELYPIRCKIGFVFQDGALFDSLTVEENLRYPFELHTNWIEERVHEEVNRRLEEADLKGINDLYPSELSGGMQKRVGLMRATMLQPKVALVDEPTAGLDPPHIKQFLETANHVKSTLGISVIVVTHDVDTVFAVCDRIAILADGVIHAIGTVDELDRSQDPIVRGILHPDFGGKTQEGLMKRKTKALEVKIGLFASVALGLILLAIWMLGSTHQLFSSKQTYYLSLPNAEGVVSGASVLISGVRSGIVGDVKLEPRQKRVRVTLDISAPDAESIRQDSLAQITTHGVLGDKVIAISAGDPSLPRLSPGSEIRAETTSTFSNLFGTRGDRLLDSIEQVARRVDQLLASATENGKMGKLIDGLVLTTRNVSTSADLLNEQLRGMKLKEAVANLNSLLGKADHGGGTVSGLINDPAIHDDVKALIGEINRNRIVRNLVRKSVNDGLERQGKEQAGSASSE